MDCLFIMPRPKRAKNRNGGNRYPHTIKPDADNLVKCCLDALNGEIWEDDSQVCEVNATKLVAARGEAPFVEIVINSVKELFDGQT